MMTNAQEVASLHLLADRNGYRLNQMALDLGISRQWLVRLLTRRFHQLLHHLLARWRRSKILALIRLGVHGEQLALQLGFANRANLCRSLRKDFGGGLRILIELPLQSS